MSWLITMNTRFRLNECYDHDRVQIYFPNISSLSPCPLDSWLQSNPASYDPTHGNAYTHNHPFACSKLISPVRNHTRYRLGSPPTWHGTALDPY